MADDGCDTCVMEVSSLGLKFDRAAEIEFAVGVFTNLSPDHIGPDEARGFCGVSVLEAGAVPPLPRGSFQQ